MLADPDRLVTQRSEEITRWVARGSQLADHAVERAERGLAELTGQLRALSPKRTLERGYAIAQGSDGHVLRGVADAVAGSPVLLTLRDGSVSTTVDADPSAAATRG